MDRTLYLGLFPHQMAQPTAADLVVTPNRSATHFLKRAHRPLTTIARDIVQRDGIAVASPLTAIRLLRAAVRSELDSADPAGIARSIQPTLREIFHAGADLEALCRVASSRVQRIARVALTYRSLLRGRRLVDEAELLWVAATRVPQRVRVLVCGYPRLGPDELAFLDALAGDGSRIVLPSADNPLFQDNFAAQAYLTSRGWQTEWKRSQPAGSGEQLAARFLGLGSTPEGAQAHVYPSLDAEVRGVLGQVKTLLAGGTRAKNIAIVARDDAFYGPTVLAIAWEYGLLVRALYRTPLTETRLGAWIGLALESAENNFSYELTARLLGHPFGEGLTPEVWAAARTTRPANLAAWQALEVDLSMLVWPEQDTRFGYVQRLRGLLQGFGISKKTWRLPREVLAFKLLQDELRALAEPAGEQLRLEAFRAELRELLSLLAVPAQPGRGGVELHTPLSLFGARYRHMFILGTVEGLLPKAVREDAALDAFERRRLAAISIHLEAPAEAARREALSFWFLLQTIEESLTISYPRLLGDREALRSPFFTALGLTASAPSGLSPSSPEESRQVLLRLDRSRDDVVLEAARHAWEVECRREGVALPDEYDGMIGIPLDSAWRVFSATQLTNLSQCPFKWFADKGLRLALPDEAEADLGPGLRGSLYHQTLKIVLDEVSDSADVRAAAIERIDDALEQAERIVGLPSYPSWAARRQEHLAALRQAIRGADFLTDGAEIVCTEADFAGEWHGLKIRGRVDRIDRTDDGLILIDYKTSGSPSLGARDAEGKLKLDLQLPLYQQVAAPSLLPGVPVAGAIYYSLTKAETLKRAKIDDSALGLLAEGIKERLRGGRFPVEPDRERKACTYCAYGAVCRKGARLDRKGVEA